MSQHPMTDPRPERRSFLVRAAAVAGGVAGAGALTASRASAAEANPALVARAFRDIQRHENAHVEGFIAFIKGLGAEARPRPTFQNLEQKDLLSFFRLSQTFENVGVGAYTGAAPAVDSPDVLAFAGTIALIEGRHAGWLNTLLNERITANVFQIGTADDQDFERPLTVEEVVKLASPFIADLNDPKGRFPLTFKPQRAGVENDLAIANFALALEFLEQEFYNINVPKFFGKK